jgi:hypothetical protein
MLWTIFVILLIMWALGLVTSYTMGGFRPYPIGHCRDTSRDQSLSGTKNLVAISAFRKRTRMRIFNRRGHRFQTSTYGALPFNP